MNKPDPTRIENSILPAVATTLCSLFLVAAQISPVNAQRIDQPDELIAANYSLLQAGTDAVSMGDCEDAIAILSSAASENVFSSHSEEVRYVVYTNLSVCAIRLEQYERSIVYVEAAIPLAGQETARRLHQLMTFAIILERLDIAVDAVTRLAEYDVGALNQLDVDLLFELHGLLNGNDDGGELKFRFLRTLHEVGYSPEHPFYTAEDFMIDYAIMLANKGEISALKDIVLTITDPGILVRVMIDRRFDVVSQDPSLAGFLDLTSAAEREVARLEQLIEDNPEYAIGAYYLSRTLAGLWRFEESLAAIEPVALKVRWPFNIGSYTDIDAAKPWVMAEYSAALERLEYPEQSAAMYVEAVEPPKVDVQNISQVINVLPRALYGGFLRETHDLARMVDLSQASTYGKMWVHSIIVCVNVMGPQISDYTESEAYLLEHERYNPGALTHSLLCKGDMDAAGRQMIGRLDDPQLRMKALLYLQDIDADSEWQKERRQHEHAATDDLSPGHILWHRFDELRARDDVLRAVNRVGRLIDVPLYSLVWGGY